GLLVAHDVHVDWQPVPGQLRIERQLIVVGGRVTEEVPGRIEEGVRDVRLATRLPPTSRAFRQVPVRVARERRHPRRIGLVVLDAGKDYRELVPRHGQSTARVAVEAGEGRPPAPLPRDATAGEA